MIQRKIFTVLTLLLVGVLHSTFSRIIQDSNSFIHLEENLKDSTKQNGETVIRTGTCHNGFTEAEIQFPEYTLITVCHDEELYETAYAVNFINGSMLDQSEPIGNRPDFKEDDFFSEISTDDCYKQVTQTETVAMLLGSEELANEYIQPGANLFMSRGHLTPSADPIYLEEKRATYYFINVSPQWQTINGGNWARLENEIRGLAGDRKSLFTVWTGSYGYLELNDVNGNPVEIWLGRDSQGQLIRKLPVNKYTWKVIYDKEANQAIAVVMINNPWEDVTAEDELCPSICDQLSWVPWNTEDVRLGYTYCCDVESFRNAVPYAPELSGVDLLN